MIWFNKTKNIKRAMACLEQQKEMMGKVCFENDLYGGQSIWSLGYVAGFASFVFHGRKSYTLPAEGAIMKIKSEHETIMQKLFGVGKAEQLELSEPWNYNEWLDGYKSGRRDADTVNEYGEYGPSWYHKVLANRHKIFGMHNAKWTDQAGG